MAIIRSAYVTFIIIPISFIYYMCTRETKFYPSYFIVCTTVASLILSALFFVKFVCPWLLKDFSDIRSGVKVIREQADLLKQQLWVIDSFEKTSDLNATKTFVIFEDEKYTFSDICNLSNKVANVAHSWNVAEDGCVALFVHNEPAFIYSFFGLLKLGIPVVVVNYNLRHQTLLHCLRICPVKAIITTTDPILLSHLEEIRDDIADIPIYTCGPESNGGTYSRLETTSLTKLISESPDVDIRRSYRSHVTKTHVCCYLFTSGTTGLPKAAVIDEMRASSAGPAMTLADITGDDAVYVTTPLYHASALFFGLFRAAVMGGTIIVKRKFSASQFWDDCRRHEATCFIYVGELCRYLLAQPVKYNESKHSIRVAIGNGLRSDIWNEFRSRFNIPRIFEFFSATEGSTFLFNRHNRPGAVGRYTPLMRFLDKGSRFLARFDVESDKPLRDENGRCIPVKPGEPGLLLSAFHPLQVAENMYYGGPKANESKLERNVVKEGDVYFNFGDLLYMDDEYFLYFADRLGDTYRWQGENVSTLQVSNILSQLDFVTDACVYGVQILGRDGKAGMALLSIVDGETKLSDGRLDSLRRLCQESLPKYAQPVFIRTMVDVPITGTYKQHKIAVAKEGFNPDVIRDPLYYLDKTSQRYSPVTRTIYEGIIDGSVCL